MAELEDQPKMSGHGGGGGRAGKSRMIRYIAVLVVLVGSALLLQFGPEFCRQVVAQSQVVRLCAPPGLTDLPTLLVLGLIAVLLLPDLSELELAGVIKLKRQLARAEARTAEVAAEVASLKATAAAAAMATSVAAPVTTVNVDVSRHVGAAETLTPEGVFVTPAAQLTDPAREQGQDAGVAFDALMQGLRASVAEDVDWGEVTLIGCTLDEGGHLQVTHAAGDEAALDRVEGQLQNGDIRFTSVTKIGSDVCVIAPAVAGGVGLVGVLAAVVTGIEVSDDDSQQMIRVAQTVAAAAGAYGQALHRLLGELPASG